MPNQSSPAVSRRTALTAATTSALLAAGAANAGGAQAKSLKQVRNDPGVPTPSVQPRTLESMFDEAASTHDVPAEILTAIGWAESHLEGRAGQPSKVNGFGIMNLVDNPTNRSLVDAAKLTGLNVDELRLSDAANILGGAAVLRRHADQLGLTGGDRQNLQAWLPAIAAYSRARDEQIRDVYANGIADTMAAGVQTEAITVRPLKQVLDYAKMAPPVAQTPPPAPDPSPSGATPPVAKPEPIGAVMPSVSQYPAYSGNYRSANRPNDYPINYVVIHVTQGSWAGALDWFQSAAAGVTAHYTVRSSDGRIGQSVAESDIAWHAGNRTYNNTSIGVEHEGFITQSSWFTDAMYRSSAALVRSICDRYGIPRTRSRIIGHIEVPLATHTDPGKYWDWTKYMSYVNAGATTPSWQLVLDNSSPEFSASENWRFSDFSQSKWGADYRFADPAAVTDTAWYSANLPSAGRYTIECRYPADSGYNDLTPYVIATPGGSEVVYVNQRHQGGQWRSLGTYQLPAGNRQIVGVSRWARGTGYVIADAIRISRVG